MKLVKPLREKIGSLILVFVLLIVNAYCNLALAISRAYKKTYNENIIFNYESYGRDEGLADLSRTVGWFTSEYPVMVDVDNEYDNVSLMKDVYSIKKAFMGVNHLGLNYASLIYTTDELEFKHCPVTFNFLSTEFVFKNDLFESINLNLSENVEFDSDSSDSDGFDSDGSVSDGFDSDGFDSKSYGITFNINKVGDSYLIGGDYAKNTYLGDKFNEFVDNLKFELEFIGNYGFEDGGIVCCLSESQLGVYLDENVYDKALPIHLRGSSSVRMINLSMILKRPLTC